MSCAAGGARGSVTVFLAVVVALVGLLSLAVGRLGLTAVAVARAETAADSAALAAAADLAAGRTPAAARRSAEVIAARNGARVVGCRCEGGQATVTVAVALPGGASLPRETRVAARAEVDPDCPG